MTEPRALLTPDRMEEVSVLLSDQGADAWLLYDFHDQNPLAHRLPRSGQDDTSGIRPSFHAVATRSS